MNYNNIKNSLNDAKTIIPCVWPLKSFIATNPLWDAIDNSLFTTASEVAKFLDVQITLDIKTYARYFAERKISKRNIAQAAKALTAWSPEEISSFTALIMQDDCIAKLAALEERLAELSINHGTFTHQIAAAHNRAILTESLQDIFNFYARYFSKEQFNSLIKSYCFENDLTEIDAYDYIEMRCRQLQLSDSERTVYFKHILASTIGYAGFVKWLEQRPNNPLFKTAAYTDDLIAIWLLAEEHLARQYPKIQFNKQQMLNTQVNLAFKPLDASFDLGVKSCTNPSLALIKFILHSAWENRYVEKMENMLASQPYLHAVNDAKAQFIFCIDTRSESIRRHLESVGNYETYGFAGFYGITMECQSTNTKTRLLSPAICEPALTLQTYKINSDLSNTYQTITNAIQLSKQNGAAALNLYDMVGAWHPLITSAKNLFPSAMKKLSQYIMNPAEHIRLPKNDKVNVDAIATQIAGVLKAIGLVDNFSPYVFVCGHEAETTNNPYHASLECGACGGNSGFLNAKVFCAYANKIEVRKALSALNIDIPSTTTFIAACHQTTTDEFIFDDNKISKNSLYHSITESVTTACARNRAEKVSDTAFPLYADNHASWCELVPEAGLVNNAMLVIGPRHITQPHNLQRRSFLHSYNHQQDSDGKILEGIMTAPMVVAHWINMQYFFSSTSPNVYGSGNKALHNVLGDIGVLEGNGGDMKIGLPLQSVSYRSELLHEPRRLAVFIYAPKERVDAIIAGNPTLQHLVHGNWLHLRVIEPKA